MIVSGDDDDYADIAHDYDDTTVCPCDGIVEKDIVKSF